MKLSLAIFTVAALGAQAVAADNTALRTQVQQQFLEEAGVEGVSNCLSKCQTILADPASKDPSASQYACSVGCDECKNNNWFRTADNTCFEMCKNKDWSAIGVCKDTIEPDKACMLGCIISLCQGTLCTGCNTSNQSCCWNQGGCASPTMSNGGSNCGTCNPDCAKYPGSTGC